MDPTMKAFCFLVIFLFWVGEGLAQNKAKDRKMESCGSCVVSGDMTLKEAQKCAMEKAMEEALNRAGVLLDVKSNQQLQQVESHAGFSESFIRAVSTEFRGGIIHAEKISEDIKLNELGFPEVVYCMRSTVRVYATRNDPGFSHHVTGVQSVYPKEARLQFNVKGPGSYMLGYFVEGDSIHAFYPNERESMIQLSAHKSISFPLPDSQTDYWIINEQKDAPKAILFVFLKEPLRPPHFLLFQDFLFWLQGIEPEERQVIIRPIYMGH